MKRLYHTVMLLFLTSMIISCSPKQKSKLEGYEWVEGLWRGDDIQQIIVKVTPDYYQMVGEMWDDNMNLDNAEKKDYTIQIHNDNCLGDIKGIADKEGSAVIYIDDAKKSLFWVYDFDQKVYLTKETNR